MTVKCQIVCSRFGTFWQPFRLDEKVGCCKSHGIWAYSGSRRLVIGQIMGFRVLGMRLHGLHLGTKGILLKHPVRC